MINIFSGDPGEFDLFMYLHNYDYTSIEDMPDEQDQHVKWAIEQYNMIYQRNHDPELVLIEYRKWQENAKP